jgi:hypothetical protein
VIKTFTCRVCGIQFQKETRSYAYYCTPCKKRVQVERVMKRRKQLNPKVQIGVGSGGNQLGPNNPYYKGGYADYKKVYREQGTNSAVCEHCGSDKHTVVHHKDENRKNANPDNLIRLCRSCHAKEHNLHLNFNIAEEKSTQNGES